MTKKIGHTAKISSCALHGGEDFGMQKRRLQSVVDIIVCSPGRLLQHYEKEHVFLSQVGNPESSVGMLSAAVGSVGLWKDRGFVCIDVFIYGII